MYATLDLADAELLKQRVFQSVLADLREGGVVLFLGAGFSHSAGVYTFQELRTVLSDTVGRLLRSEPRLPPQVRADVAQVFEDESLLFEHVIEHLYRVLGERATRWLRILDARPQELPSRHNCVARLAAVGAVSTIITPNFDTVLEQGLTLHDVGFSGFCPHTGERFDVTGSNGHVRIVKPHGTFALHSDAFKHDSLIATTSGIGHAPDPVTEAVITHMTEGRYLVFAGLCCLSRNWTFPDPGLACPGKGNGHEERTEEVLG